MENQPLKKCSQYQVVKSVFILGLSFLTSLASGVQVLNQYGMGSDGHHLGVQLSDLKVFDLYQLSPEDPKFKRDDLSFAQNFGWIAFVYRELSHCPPEVVCRRRAMVWISPSFEIIELGQTEQDLADGNLFLQSGGVGLGGGQGFSFYPSQTARMKYKLRGIHIYLSGNDGETADLRLTHSDGDQVFKMARVYGLPSDLRQIKSPQALIKDLRGSFYYPIRVAPLPKMKFTAFYNPEKGLGILIHEDLSGPKKGQISGSLWSAGASNDGVLKSELFDHFNLHATFQDFRKDMVPTTFKSFYKIDSDTAALGFIGAQVAIDMSPNMDEWTFRPKPVILDSWGEAHAPLTKKISLTKFELQNSPFKATEIPGFHVVQDEVSLRKIIDAFWDKQAEWKSRIAYKDRPAHNPFFERMGEIVNPSSLNSCNSILKYLN